MTELGIEVNKSNMEIVKKLFKSHLSVKYTSALSDKEYSLFIDSVSVLIAEGWGIELPKSQERIDMKNFLKMIYEWKG